MASLATNQFRRSLRPPLTLLAVLAVLLAGLVAAPAPAAAPLVKIRFAGMERGPDPAVPHVDGTTLVDGGRRIPLPGARPALLGRSGDAYVVRTSRADGSRARVLVVAVGAEPRRLVGGDAAWQSALSDDGRILVTPRSRRSATVITVLRVRTGATVVSRRFAGHPHVMDADRGRVLLGSWEPQQTLLWRLGTDRVRVLVRRAGAAGDLSTDRLSWYTGDPYEGGCAVVATVAAPRAALWRSCTERVEEFSPDGRTMLTTDLLSDGIGPGQLGLRRVGGRLVARYDAPGWFGHTAWEDPTALLLETSTRRRTALVRCVVDECERASDLRRTPDLRAAQNMTVENRAVSTKPTRS